jgi:CIC family chloride channel protein
MIPESMPFAEFKKHFSETEQHYFPVMEQQGKLSRIFSVNDVRGVLVAPGIGQLVVMKDIGTSQIITALPSEDLNSVLKKFTVNNIDSLPVVRDEDPRKLTGMLNPREVITYYNQRVQDMTVVA